MTARIRRFRRFTTYLLLIAVTGVLSLFGGDKQSDEHQTSHSLIPPVPNAHADTPPADGGGALDTESSSCSSNGDGPACVDGVDAGDSGDGGGGCAGDGCCGSAE